MSNTKISLPPPANLLRMLPAVDHLLNLAGAMPDLARAPRAVLVQCARRAVDRLRTAILRLGADFDPGRLDDAAVMALMAGLVADAMRPNLRRVINATGVVIHTNLGRSRLAPSVIENLAEVAGRYSNLEFDLAAGRRGSRYSAVEDLLTELGGAEAAMAVNNNAGAVLLALETLARGREVIVSRGELVEIGGAFRIPDVMARSGAILKEVGATNRTHLRDYLDAVTDRAALFLKVHKSNYDIVGFTAEVALPDLVAAGRERGIPVMEDLGSGSFVDLSRFGLIREPTVRDSVAAGAQVVTFSGDKLLGGPQAGIILGERAVMERIKKNPLTRALRIDKLTLAALESTLRLYRDPERAMDEIPTLRALSMPLEMLAAEAHRLAGLLESIGDDRLEVEVRDVVSRVGGGALPLQELPSRCVAVSARGLSVNAVESALRRGAPPLIGRIESDRFLMDPRTLMADDPPAIRDLFAGLLATPPENRPAPPKKPSAPPKNTSVPPKNTSAPPENTSAPPENTSKEKGS